MIKEAVYRSPKWLRKYVDFEVSTGDDISDKASLIKQEKELREKWNKRWLEFNEQAFKYFFKEVYKNYVNKNLSGYVLSHDLETIKSDFEGDMELWDKFDKWLKEKKEKEERQARIYKELDALKDRLTSDFRSAPYNDKFETPTINGKVCFHYTFENGDTFKMCDNEIKYGGSIYTVGFSHRIAFVSLVNSIVNNARRRKSRSSSSNSRSSSSNSRSSSSYKRSRNSDPKRSRYDEILDKIKLREEQIRKMSDSDPNKELLKNELDNYKRAAQRMKDKYKFEHLSGFDNFIKI